MWLKNWIAAFLVLLLSTATLADDFQCEVAKRNKADFIFIIDTSVSMCTYVDSIRSGLAKFAQDLIAADINDYRFAIVTFGGPPLLRLKFTSNVNSVINSLSEIKCDTGGQEAALEAIRRTLLNELENESIFSEWWGTKLININWNNPSAKGQIDYRDDSSLNLIVVTDEDSDLPTNFNYYVGLQFNEVIAGQAWMEPGWRGQTTMVAGTRKAAATTFTYTTTKNNGGIATLSTKKSAANSKVIRTAAALPTLLPGFQGEVDQAAQLIKERNARISILIRPDGNNVGDNIADGWSRHAVNSNFNSSCSYIFRRDDENDSIYKREDDEVLLDKRAYQCDQEDVWNTWTGVWQFGSPYGASQDSDFSNFKPVETYENLYMYGLGNSLQAQVLKNGGYARVFDIDGLTNSVVLNNFYSAAVELVNLCTSTVKWEEVGYTHTGNAVISRIYSTYVKTSNIVVSTTIDITNTVVDIVTPTRSVTEITTETETSVIPTSATETSVIEEQEIISETFNYLIQPATVTYETVETAQAETTESIYDSFTEFPTVVVVESFQTLVTEVISTDVSVTNSHSTLTSVSETEVVGKSVTDTTSFTETSVITEEFNKIYVYETVSPLVIETVQAETTESVYDSFTESPTVTVVESFQTSVTEVISTDVSVTNSHSTLTSVSETEVVGKSVTDTTSFTETSVITEEFNKIYVYETVSPLVIETVQAETTKSVYDSFTESPTVTVVESFKALVTEVISTEVSVTNSHSTLTSVSETKVIGKSTTTVVPVSETSIVVEQFDYLIQHETKVITDVLSSTVIKSETHYSSLFSTPVVSETTTKVIHATANAKATVTNVHHVTSVVAKTEVPVETSIIVENHTTVKPYTEVATETVTPVAESTSTVEDEEEGGGSSTVGIAAGVAAGGLAAAGAAAAAFYYYSPTNTVDSAGVFQDGGLSGGNVNPLYANDPSATLSSNVNPLYDN